MRGLGLIVLCSILVTSALGAALNATLETQDGTASIYLACGISPVWYSVMACENPRARFIALRQAMGDDDGDWCLFGFVVSSPDSDFSDFYVIDKRTRIGFAYGDSDSPDTTYSDRILTTDARTGTTVFDSETDMIILKPCPDRPPIYHFDVKINEVEGGRIPEIIFQFYIRFPSNTCLSNKGDDLHRRFTKRPIAIWVDQAGGVCK